MEKTYRQLSMEERTMIQTQMGMGVNPAAIAAGLTRSPSTITRELRRNGWVRPQAKRRPGRPPLAGGYSAVGAHRRARSCTAKARVRRKLYPGTALWGHVTRYLKTGYSPEPR